MRHRVALAAFACLSCITLSSRAETGIPWETGVPDSGTCVSPMVTPPAYGWPIPANTPALPFEGTHVDGSLTTSIDDMALVAPDGSVVDASVEGDLSSLKYRLLVPAAPLSPGSGYTLSYREMCSKGTSADKTRTFDVGDESPLPTKIGTLDLAWTLDSDQLRITVTFSDELKPFLQTTWVSISAETMYTHGYGSLTRDPLMQTLGVCAGVPTGTLVKGTVKVTAHLAGTSGDLPTLTADYSHVCTRGWDSKPDVGGYWDEGVGDYEYDYPTPDTGYAPMPIDDVSDRDVTPRFGCTCNTASRSQAQGEGESSLAALGVVPLTGLLGLLLRRRRNRNWD